MNSPLAALALALLLAGCAASRAPREAADDARFARVEAAMADGRREEARTLLAALAADYPTLAGPLVNLGILAAADGRDEEAESAFRQALAMEPGHAVAWAELGIVLRRQGRFGEADAAYRAALEAAPDYALAWRNRGVLLDLYLDRPGEALDCYERYLALGDQRDAEVTAWVAELRLRLSSRVAGR